jgi:hypothetical protein
MLEPVENITLCPRFAPATLLVHLGVEVAWRQIDKNEEERLFFFDMIKRF